MKRGASRERVERRDAELLALREESQEQLRARAPAANTTVGLKDCLLHDSSVQKTVYYTIRPFKRLFTTRFVRLNPLREESQEQLRARAPAANTTVGLKDGLLHNSSV